MAIETNIEWADSTWNPFIGCTKISPACDHCYAERWAKMAGRDFSRVSRAAPATFQAPEKWREPRRIFVCSLSDFFHPDIFHGDREEAIDVMKEAPQHTYMILTKRPHLIQGLLLASSWANGLPDNVWLGVTVESQAFTWRIREMLNIPAGKHFVSCEPLLGLLDLKMYASFSRLLSVKITRDMKTGEMQCTVPRINWIIAGGESGRGARPMHPDWPRGLRNQCAAARVPFFFKQWGEWFPVTRDQEHRRLDGKEYNEVPK